MVTVAERLFTAKTALIPEVSFPCFCFDRDGTPLGSHRRVVDVAFNRGCCCDHQGQLIPDIFALNFLSNSWASSGEKWLVQSPVSPLRMKGMPGFRCSSSHSCMLVRGSFFMLENVDSCAMRSISSWVKGYSRKLATRDTVAGRSTCISS